MQGFTTNMQLASMRWFSCTIYWSQSRRHPVKILNDLDFADDIFLLESSIPSAQAQLTRTAAAAEQLGLIISVPKTEYMTINCNPQPPLQVYGQPMKHVLNFKYLGSMMASGVSDQSRRRALAWVTFWKLEKIWRSPSISISTKIKLFNTTCVTVLLYGCESWVISGDMENKINLFAISCYRIMLNIKAPPQKIVCLSSSDRRSCPARL